MISADELVKDFLRGRAVHLAILNSQCNDINSKFKIVNKG